VKLLAVGFLGASTPSPQKERVVAFHSHCASSAETVHPRANPERATALSPEN
jgi:hypothetical protein